MLRLSRRPLSLVATLPLALLGSCAASFAGPQDPEPQDVHRVQDAVDTNAPVLGLGWRRESTDFRIRGAGAVGLSTFEGSASPVDPRSGDYFGAFANFRSEFLYAPGSNFEIGPRVLIGGRGYEFENDNRLDYEAFDLFGELVARAYLGDQKEQSIRPYFEAFAGGGLQTGRVEFSEVTPFARIDTRRTETGGVFTFGGGAGIEFLTDDDWSGTLGVEVRNIQSFDSPFFDSELSQFDVALVFGIGTSL